MSRDLINAHGPDHGLRVTLRFAPLGLGESTVEIEQWAELCEPNEDGSSMPHTQTAEITLRAALEYAAKRGETHASQSRRVIAGALEYLAHYGGTETLLDDGTLPCEIFDHDPAVFCPHCSGASE